MLVDTKYLGEQEISTDKIIQFESGIPGFQSETSFVILDIPGNDILQIMQSIKNANLAFFITNPHDFYRDYRFELDESVVESLGIAAEQDVVIYTIMTVQDPFEKSTINLRAPIVINSSKKSGKQFILNDESHPLRASISSTSAESGGE